MKFEELLAMETYGAFEDFRTVEEAKKLGWIPKAYHEVFIEKCSCGSERIINESLTQLECCDPRCYIKMGHTLSQMFINFGCSNMGPSICKSIMYMNKSDLKYGSPIEVLGLNYIPYGITSGKAQYYIDAIEHIKKVKLTLPELISKLAIPKLGETAHKIFKGYSTIDEFCAELSAKGGAKSIRSMLTQKGIEDRRVWFYMRHYLVDILIACDLLRDVLRPLAYQEFKIVVTGSVAPRGKTLSRTEFIELLNEKGTLPNGKRLVGFKVSGALKSAPFIVADYASNTPKYRAAKEREETEGKVMYTSTELLEWVEGVVKPYADQLKEESNDNGK